MSLFLLLDPADSSADLPEVLSAEDLSTTEVAVESLGRSLTEAFLFGGYRGTKSCNNLADDEDEDDDEANDEVEAEVEAAAEEAKLCPLASSRFLELGNREMMEMLFLSLLGTLLSACCCCCCCL